MEKLEFGSLDSISWKMVCCSFCCCCLLLSSFPPAGLEEKVVLEAIAEKLDGIGAVAGVGVALNAAGVALDADVGAVRIDDSPVDDLAERLDHRVFGDGVPIAKLSVAKTSAQVSAPRASSAGGRATLDLS